MDAGRQRRRNHRAIYSYDFVLQNLGILMIQFDFLCISHIVDVPIKENVGLDKPRITYVA